MPEVEISLFGAIASLVVSIALIMFKWNPAYSLIFGAFIGGFVSSADVELVVKEMVKGASEIAPAILRVLTAGILAGVLIRTKSAEKIARSAGAIFGRRGSLYALTIATFILTFSGVFVDVAVITVAPIAMTVASRTGVSKLALLIALVGGGKSGNSISPNPNTISCAANFDVPLPSVMFANMGAALVGLLTTFLIVYLLSNFSGREPRPDDQGEDSKNLPNIFAALSGPIVAMGLLALNPLFGIAIDPMIALPAGGVACSIFTFKFKNFLSDSTSGLYKMTPMAILLLGTGCLGGIIKASALKGAILSAMDNAGLSDIFIAPISGALMSAATASTTAGAAIASATFSQAVLSGGISAVWGAAMTNAGAIVLDQMPHGSFFHITGSSVGLDFSKRMKAVPFEILIGGSIAVASTLSCWIFS